MPLRLVFLTARGEAVRPIAVAAGRRVEARWSTLTSAEQIEGLRDTLEELLAKLRKVSATQRERIRGA